MKYTIVQNNMSKKNMFRRLLRRRVKLFFYWENQETLFNHVIDGIIRNMNSVSEYFTVYLCYAYMSKTSARITKKS